MGYRIWGGVGSDRTPDHSHRIRGRCLVPRPGNVVPIRGSGSKRVSVPFKVGSCPGLKGVAAPLLADLIGIRRLRTVDWCGFVAWSKCTLLYVSYMLVQISFFISSIYIVFVFIDPDESGSRPT